MAKCANIISWIVKITTMNHKVLNVQGMYKRTFEHRGSNNVVTAVTVSRLVSGLARLKA